MREKHFQDDSVIEFWFMFVFVFYGEVGMHCVRHVRRDKETLAETFFEGCMR